MCKRRNELMPPSRRELLKVMSLEGAWNWLRRWGKRRRNAKKWKDLGTEVAMQGGSSDKYLKAFLDETIQDKTGS